MADKISAYHAGIYTMAARYAHTRNTGAALLVVRAILADWEKIPAGVINQIVREAESEAMTNREDWQMLFDRWRAEQ